MEKKIVLTGIARAKGKVAAEALVERDRFGWGFNHVSNTTGVLLLPGYDLEGQCLAGKVVVYPTVRGSTVGSASLYYKAKYTKKAPAALICREVHHIDIAGAIDAEIPAVDSLDQDPIETIKAGDWVEVDAPEVGGKATVTITRKE